MRPFPIPIVDRATGDLSCNGSIVRPYHHSIEDDRSARRPLPHRLPARRTAQYGFVHELIRATLVSGLSLPRRQRVHLKIADALERLRASSLDRHVSALAHHLYQAGAAADSQRAAKFLALAGRHALAAGAFEDALDTFEHLMGLELADDDPVLADAFEHRGSALQALRRPDEAV
jgi:predicted ATPase